MWELSRYYLSKYYIYIPKVPFKSKVGFILFGEFYSLLLLSLQVLVELVIPLSRVFMVRRWHVAVLCLGFLDTTGHVSKSARSIKALAGCDSWSVSIWAPSRTDVFLIVCDFGDTCPVYFDGCYWIKVYQPTQSRSSLWVCGKNVASVWVTGLRRDLDISGLPDTGRVGWAAANTQHMRSTIRSRVIILQPVSPSNSPGVWIVALLLLASVWYYPSSTSICSHVCSLHWEIY